MVKILTFTVLVEEMDIETKREQKGNQVFYHSHPGFTGQDY